METVTSLYTSQAEIERYWSKRAAALHVNDFDDDEVPDFDNEQFQTDVWEEIVTGATDEANFYLLRFHQAADLANNRWVRTRATWIGCYLLSLRRGDPGYYTTLYERAIGDFQRVDETHPVPRLGLKTEFTPAMSNIRIDDRFRVAKERVEPMISTGGTSGRQHLDPDVALEPWQR